MELENYTGEGQRNIQCVGQEKNGIKSPECPYRIKSGRRRLS